MEDLIKNQLIKTLNNRFLAKEQTELLFSAGASGLDPEWLRAISLDHFCKEKNTLDTSKIADACLAKWREILDAPGFTAAVSGTDNEIYVNIFHQVIDAKILANVMFLAQYDSEVQTINQYRDVLLSKKRQLVTRDKWGDPDATEWHELLHSFAIEKLGVGAWDKTFLELPDVIQDHLRQCVQGRLGAGIVMMLLDSAVTADGLIPRDSKPVISSGRDYELFLKQQIEKAFPSFSVDLTPASGDQGADLIVSTPSSKIAIQVKYYASPVGNAAVQEIFAAKSFYHADDCMVICNSSYTPSAKLLANRTGVLLATEADYLQILKELN
jgi:hypothetical protein